jgi:hypothetical protein
LPAERLLASQPEIHKMALFTQITRVRVAAFPVFWFQTVENCEVKETSKVFLYVQKVLQVGQLFIIVHKGWKMSLLIPKKEIFAVKHHKVRAESSSLSHFPLSLLSSQITRATLLFLSILLLLLLFHFQCLFLSVICFIFFLFFCDVGIGVCWIKSLINNHVIEIIIHYYLLVIGGFDCCTNSGYSKYLQIDI